MATPGDGLTGNYRVRAIRPALHKVYKMFHRCRDQMEVRAHALKLRHWPAWEVVTENGILIDLDWSWIQALKGLRIGELRIADKIGGKENLRIIFYEGDKTVCEPMPMMWVLDVLLKKKDYFTANELAIFRARRTLVIERFLQESRQLTFRREESLGKDLAPQGKEASMEMMATKRGPDSAQLLSKLFADVFQSFMECSNEVQEAIRDMVMVVNSPESTEEERDSALETIAEALFPSRHNGEIGINFGEDYAKGAPADVKRILQNMEKEQASFGERVSAILEAKGMTQGDLANAVGIGQPAISNIVSRDCRPQKRTVEKIAAALKTSPEELWPGIKDD